MDRDDEILDYLQERMTPAARDRFEADMANNAALAAEVEVMRSVRAALASGPAHENKDAVWERLSHSINQTSGPANFNRAPKWAGLMKYAAVAVVAVATWQLGVVPQMSQGPNGFRPASVEAAQFVLQVRFNDEAAFADIVELLYPLNGTIVDGPGALGLVQVSFADATARSDAIVALETSNLVEFVQSD